MWALPWRPLFCDELDVDSAGDLLCVSVKLTFCSVSVSIDSIGNETQSNDVSDDNSLLLSIENRRKTGFQNISRIDKIGFFFDFNLINYANFIYFCNE